MCSIIGFVVTNLNGKNCYVHHQEQYLVSSDLHALPFGIEGRTQWPLFNAFCLLPLFLSTLLSCLKEGVTLGSESLHVALIRTQIRFMVKGDHNSYSFKQPMQFK